MPINCDDPMARFGFDLYRQEHQNDPSEDCFTTEDEMRQHLTRLEAAGNFFEIHLFRAGPDGEWEEAFEIIKPTGPEEEEQ